MGSGWLKLAVFAFVGIIISVVVLGMTASSGLVASNSSHTTSSTHTLHQQAGANTGTSGMNMNNAVAMGGTSQMQSMYPNYNVQMNSTPTNYDFYMMQQQMMQMQNQIIMIKQKIDMMNSQIMNNMGNMQQSSMPASGGSSMQGGTGMMMPMNNMQPSSGSMGGMM